jgi:hypothetical protein
MLSRREEREIAQAAEAVALVLREAVAATVAEPGPAPAREVVARILELDEQAGGTDGAGPGARWIEEHLGARYRARARYTSGALRSDEAAVEIADYLDALRDDFLPSLVWLLAGAAACYSDGDVDRLLGAAPPP